MTRILLVDDSPHAQRIGERILTGEGFEVVTVSNADTALVRIDDVDPDVVIADTVMPGRTGYEICQYLKMSPRHRHVRVILTAGVLEPIDDTMALRVQADESLKKPFEATALVTVVRRLAEEAARDRKETAGVGGAAAPLGAVASVGAPQAAAAAPFVAVVDAEQVRAAVTLALDASMDAMAEEISRRVLAKLLTAAQTTKPAAKAVEAAPAAQLGPQLIPHAAAPPPAERIETVRRVSPLRIRSSILGLEAGPPDSQ
jgi:CheY-like chemotaxis protein